MKSCVPESLPEDVKDITGKGQGKGKDCNGLQELQRYQITYMLITAKSICASKLKDEDASPTRRQVLRASQQERAHVAESQVLLR